MSGWSRELPTVPGYYMHKRDGGATTLGRVVGYSADRFAFHAHGQRAAYPIQQWGGEWFRLPSPEEWSSLVAERDRLRALLDAEGDAAALLSSVREHQWATDLFELTDSEALERIRSALAAARREGRKETAATFYSLLLSALTVPSDRRANPRPGDTVIETTRFVPDPSMIGVLVAQPAHNEWIVDPMDGGQRQRWRNADAKTIRAAAGDQPR